MKFKYPGTVRQDLYVALRGRAWIEIRTEVSTIMNAR